MEFTEFARRHLTGALAAVFLMLFLFFVFRYTGLSAAGRSVHIGEKRPVVVIDAGHGGGNVRQRGGKETAKGLQGGSKGAAKRQ